MRRTLFSNVFLFICCAMAGLSYAQSMIDFSKMENEIFREPKNAYATILSLENQYSSMSDNEKLWWLVRKAQSENVLYLFDEFTKTVNTAELLLTENTPSEISSLIYTYAGIVARNDVNYKMSAEKLTLALTHAKQANLNRNYVYAKQELAYTHSLNQSYETSLLDLQEAYVEAFAMEDHFLISTINETYGAIYGYMYEYEKSIEYYEKALDTYENLGYKWHVAEATFGLASTYRYWGKYDLAIEKFALYDKRTAYSGDQTVRFYSLYGQGMTMAEKGDCALAIPIIHNAYLLEGIADYVGELKKREASCLVKLGQLDKAEQVLAETVELFDSLPDVVGTTWQLEVEKIAGQLAFAKGDYMMAYELMSDYYQRYSEILIKNSSSKLMNLRAAMGLERHNVELSLLQQRSKVQDLQIEQQNQRNTMQGYFIVFAIVLLSIFIGVLVIQRKSNQKILALSITDSLSGLYNRRYIFEYLDKLIEGTSTSKRRLSVLLFDIDDFKHINDTFGHPFGDEVIRKVADIGKQALRSEDVIGRIGGEEFLCVLPRITEAQCQLIAKRILEGISEYKFSHHQQTIKITVSVGIADYTEQLKTGEAIYAKADQALYEAKRLGKNRVSVYRTLTKI